MRWYGIALFIHMMGLIAMFAGFALQQRLGAKLRATFGRDEARHWAWMLDATRPMTPSGAVMMFVSGGYMAWGMRATLPPWVMVGIGSVAFIGMTTGLMVNPRFAAIHRALASDPAAAAAAIRDGATWAAFCAANGAGLGTIWIMSVKAGLLESLIAVLLPAAVGGVVGFQLARRVAAPATA
ncbi:MAG TPA: hypothetical protein VFT45_16935 [Longimicrobium sp.]|nr:hypothetical protein [Longimicrobium sp.]